MRKDVLSIIIFTFFFCSALTAMGQEKTGTGFAEDFGEHFVIEEKYGKEIDWEDEFIAQGLVRATELIDFDVEGYYDDLEGEVEDLVITADGRIPYVIIELEGSTYLAPVPALSVNWQDGSLLVNLRSEDLDSLTPLGAVEPAGERDETGNQEILEGAGEGDLPDVLGDADFTDTARTEWDAETYTEWASLEYTGLDSYDQTRIPVGVRAVTVEELLDYDLMNRQDEDLGSIDDLVLNTKTGRITYAAVEAGGWLGIGDELFAVPVEALTLEMDEETVYLSVDEDVLEEAEGFNEEEWPTGPGELWETVE